MSSVLVQFLHENAEVPVQFIDDFEQVALVWNLKSIMKQFSKGRHSILPSDLDWISVGNINPDHQD